MRSSKKYISSSMLKGFADCPCAGINIRDCKELKLSASDSHY